MLGQSFTVLNMPHMLGLKIWQGCEYARLHWMLNMSYNNALICVNKPQ